MSAVKAAARRLRALFGRGAFERDLDEELRFHFEMEVEKRVRQGMTPDAARLQAMKDFGGVQRFKDEVRDVRGLTVFDNLSRDVRFALRTLRRSPGFFAVAVLCLSLGIGANAALFSVVNAVLLRPLPYAAPERLARLYETQPGRGPSWTGSVSWPNFADWREQARSFDRLFAFQATGMNLRVPAGAERVSATQASDGFFDALGPRFLLGRPFAPEEFQRGRDRVVVLSEPAWARRFDRDPAALGKTLTLDGAPYEVVGVVPATFRFPSDERTDVYVPLVPPEEMERNRGNHSLAVVGRLRPGVTLEAANAELRQLAAQLAAAHPEQQVGRSASALALTETVVSRVRPALLLMLGAVALVLLIACANVANLLLARGASRRQELALRVALGASRRRIVGQLLVESGVLALAGAGLGLLFAYWGLTALQPLAEEALPLAEPLTLDGPVLLFLVLASATSAVVFGLAPALQSTKLGLRGGHQVSRRFRDTLVIAEVALSLLLLVGAGLFLRGFITLLLTPPGVTAQGVLTARLTASPGRYGDRPLSSALLSPTLERVRALPGVEAAGMISLLPIRQAWTNLEYAIEGAPKPEPGKAPLAEYRITSPGLFKALGVPVVAGRDFTEEDGQAEELRGIVNQAFVREAFNGGDALGRRILLDPPVTIVGVVGDVRQAGLDLAPLAELHLPYNHKESIGWGSMTLVVRTPREPMALAGGLRAAVASVDADQPLYDVASMEDVISRSMSNRRLQLLLLGTFALMAFLLSSAGLYGVLAYLVSQRTQEIGVRMALGAQALDVVALVMKQGGRLAGLGILLGLAGALALGKLIEGLLYGVSARDPLTLAGIALAQAAVALLACYLPARRAARVDPVLAIKAE